MGKKTLIVCAAVVLFLLVLIPGYSVNRLKDKEIIAYLQQLIADVEGIHKVEIKETDGVYLTIDYSLTTDQFDPAIREELFTATKDYLLTEEIRQKIEDKLDVTDPRMFTEGLSIRFRNRVTGTYWSYSYTNRGQEPRWDVIGKQEDGTYGVIETWYPNDQQDEEGSAI